MATASINGYKMHYSDSGQGIPILFIHPPVLTSVNFMYQLQGLSSELRTIAFDIRGHGKSQPSAEGVTYPLIAHDICRLLDHLQIDSCYLCGYSTGGSVVLEFLLTYPQRARGGIIISGMSEVNHRQLRNKITTGILLARLGAIKTLALTTSWSQAEHPLTFWRLYRDARNTDAANAEQYYRASLSYNCTSLLPRINHPMLLFYGELDTLFHPYAYLMHTLLPKSELVIVKQADHRLPTKSPQSLNRRIKQFIQQYQ